MPRDPNRNRTPLKDKLRNAAMLANEALADKGNQTAVVEVVGRKLIVTRRKKSS